MTKWEYVVLTRYEDLYSSDEDQWSDEENLGHLERINGLGKDGWQVFQVNTYYSVDVRHLGLRNVKEYHFRRELKAKRNSE